MTTTQDTQAAGAATLTALNVTEWIRNHYQDHATVDGLCLALDAALSTATAPSAPDSAAHSSLTEPGKYYDAFLCRAWGETDLTSAEIVQGWDGVRAFMVREWLGEEGATNGDGGNTLDQFKADFEEHQADERGSAFTYTFEIGGVSVERVTGFAAQAPEAVAERKPWFESDLIHASNAGYAQGLIDGKALATPAQAPAAARYETMGYALAMRVMQSDLYPTLDGRERAECDEFIRIGQAPAMQAPAAPFGYVTKDTRGAWHFFESRPYLDNAVECFSVFKGAAAIQAPETNDMAVRVWLTRDPTTGEVLRADGPPAIQAPEAVDWPKLDKPARVVGTFGVGVSAGFVVRAAQRHYEATEAERLRTPLERRDDELRRRAGWDLFNGYASLEGNTPSAAVSAGPEDLAAMQMLWDDQPPEEKDHYRAVVKRAPTQPQQGTAGLTGAQRNEAVADLQKQYNERMDKAEPCSFCEGEGRTYRDGRNARTGRRTCIACQGLGVKGGWSNPVKPQAYFSEEEILEAHKNLTAIAKAQHVTTQPKGEAP